MMEPDGWRWANAAPTLPSDFELSGKRSTSSSEGGGGRGSVRSRLKFTLVGSEGVPSGRGSPT